MQRAKLSKRGYRPPPPRRFYEGHFRDRAGRTALEREAETLVYIRRFAQEHRGHMPTLREICENVGISSTSVARYTIQNLVNVGKLEYIDGYLTLPDSKLVLNAKNEGDQSLLPVR